MTDAPKFARLIGLAAALCVLTIVCVASSNAQEKETLLTIVFSADSLGEVQPCG